MKWQAVTMILCLFATGCQALGNLNSNEVGGHQQLAKLTTTYTKSGKAGDPINVGLIGEIEDIVHAFIMAGWQPADFTTLKSSVQIVKDVIFKEPYPNAPVSDLYLWDRTQDIAFEQEVNGSPNQRHHVRLWLSDVTVNDRPLWIGASTYDSGIYLRNFSHHIAPDIDAERAYLFETLTNANIIKTITIVPGIGPTDRGLNGEDDSYFTDGQIHIGWLK
jgi:hypothetical protein